MTAFVHGDSVRQRLAAVLSFHDAFHDGAAPTVPLIRRSLSVSIPSLRWAAIDPNGDGTFRFAYPGGVEITGLFDVVVTDASGEYVDFEPLALGLPRPVSSPPLRSDFWLVRPLWPTPRFVGPPGETAIVGRITSPTSQPVEGLLVRLHTQIAPPPNAPYAYCDARGEFHFRFPRMPAPLGGASETFHVTVTDPSSTPVPVTPPTFAATLGRRQFFSFERN